MGEIGLSRVEADGARDEELGPMLHNLGGAYCDLGDAKRARDLIERALLLTERVYGPEHEEVARGFTSLGLPSAFPPRSNYLKIEWMKSRDRDGINSQPT